MAAAKTVLVLTLFAAAFILPATSKADETALTAKLQQVLDAYVKDRASIEGLSGAASGVGKIQRNRGSTTTSGWHEALHPGFTGP